MVKKLLRYEFKANLKLLLPIELIVLGTAVLNRILQFFESDTTAYHISFGSSVVLLAISVIGSVIGVLVIVVRRYYKNMFSNEGYLTMSLPVTPFEHIFCKTLTAFVCELIALAVAAAAVLIAVSGELLTEIVKAAAYLFDMLEQEMQVNIILYAIECGLNMLLAAINSVLLFYACISIGQRAKKNRIAMSVVAFVAYDFIMQIFATVSTVLISVQYELMGDQSIIGMIVNNPKTSVHVVSLIAFVFGLICGAVYYLICHRTLSRKLNLE